MTLNPANSHHLCFKAFLDAISPDLVTDLAAVAALPPRQANQVIAEVLRCACQATHASLIELGRDAAASLPRPWLLERIERVADQTINHDDDWEYRRLLELYEILDVSLLSNLVRRGLDNPNAGIAEAAQDFARAAGHGFTARIV